MDRIRDIDVQALALVSEAVEQGDRNAALAWLKLRRLSGVDVERVGLTDSDRIIEAEAATFRSRPENAGILMQPLDDGLYAFTREESIALTEGELLDRLLEST